MKHLNYLSKARNVVTCGLLATMVIAGSSVSAFAAEVSGNYGSHVNPVNPEYQQVETIAHPTDESMADFVKSLDMLTKEEKSLLVKAEDAKTPYYKQMNELTGQIDEKTTAIVKKANPIFDQIFAIKNAHKDLWTKLDTHENKAQKTVGNDYIKFIQLSDVLTKSEKELLIRDQTKIDGLYEKVDTYYAQAEKATADLKAQLEVVISNIQKIDSKTTSIWEKVYNK